MRSLVSHTKSGCPFGILKMQKKLFCWCHYNGKWIKFKVEKRMLVPHDYWIFENAELNSAFK